MPADAPLAICVRDIGKSFRIPDRRVDSLKERLVHPFHRIDYRDLKALQGISFDVRQGEFFGIVGRNGSGKSTLLKIIASIYRADGGKIFMTGRLAPFIELGVGFNMDLTARENVVLNGVMMGLSPGEAERRIDAVIDFAELHEFTELKLKNYSSGMLVRLAFSVMIESDADIMLIDEVLAVGDASFQQKCADIFHQFRESGKTIVLVTHDMASVEAYCHRAMLIEGGEIRYTGDPEEVGRRYMRMNFDGEQRPGDEIRDPGEDEYAQLVDAWLEDEDGSRVSNVEQGKPIIVKGLVEARRPVSNPGLGLLFSNADGVKIFGFSRNLSETEGEGVTIQPGQRIEISTRIENDLAVGRYTVGCYLAQEQSQPDFALGAMRLLDFVVFGTLGSAGVVVPDGEMEIRIAREP